MKNVQISFDEKLLKSVDHLATSCRLSRSAIVREALKHWVREQEIKEFEENWISTLKKNSEKQDNTEEWIPIETWGDE